MENNQIVIVDIKDSFKVKDDFTSSTSALSVSKDSAPHKEKPGFWGMTQINLSAVAGLSQKKMEDIPKPQVRRRSSFLSAIEQKEDFDMIKPCNNLNEELVSLPSSFADSSGASSDFSAYFKKLDGPEPEPDLNLMDDDTIDSVHSTTQIFEEKTDDSDDSSARPVSVEKMIDSIIRDADGFSKREVTKSEKLNKKKVKELLSQAGGSAGNISSSSSMSLATRMSSDDSRCSFCVFCNWLFPKFYGIENSTHYSH